MKYNKDIRLCFWALLVFVLCMFTSTSLFAQVTKIPAPTNLRGQYIEPGLSTGDAGKVVLQWDWTSNNPSERFGPFIIHRSFVDVPPFPIVGSSIKSEFIDGSLPLGDTTYYYYVRKLGPDSTISDPSEIISVHVSPFERLIITSLPPIAGIVGKQYEYQVTAISTIPGDLITYKLVSNSLGTIPPGMVIDGLTGLIHWTPTADGLFGITIEATNKSGNISRQSFTICVSPSYDITSLHGKVTDVYSRGIENVTIFAYSISIDQNHQTDCSGNRYMPQHAVTDNGGNYAFDSLKVGAYILIAVPLSKDYLPVWWKKGNNLQQADKCILSKDLNNVADFVLNSSLNANLIRICGSVLDVTGKSIYHAAVRAIIFDPISNLPIRTSIDNTLVTSTDADGSYCMRVPSNVPFVLYAQAPKFYSEFFNNKLNILSADRLNLSTDKSGIIFTLRDRNNTRHKISGRVTDRNEGVESWIVMYHQNISSVKSIETIPTASDGSFTSEDLSEQNVLVQAIPTDLKQHSSAYYTGSPLIGFNWSQSQTVQLSSAISNADIFVDKVFSVGLGTAEGRIFDLAQQPVSGAIVKAVSDDNTIVGMAVTDTDGDFMITGLPEGPFTISCDKVSYEQVSTNSAYIQYGMMPQAKGIFVRMAPSTISSVNEQNNIPSDVTLSQNFPNPIIQNGYTTISFSLANTQFVQIKITDVIGREIGTLASGTMSAGRHSISWNANQIKPGMYFYTLIAGEKRITKKLVITG